jgi:hypothetical protein
MNVEIGAEAAQFPEKEYINGFSGAVQALQNNLENLLPTTISPTEILEASLSMPSKPTSG